MFTASSVEFDPVPAIIGIFPFDSFTQSSITLLCSASVNVGHSPVVPAGTIPLVPLDKW